MELKIFRDTMPQAGTVCTVKAELPLETEILVSDYLPPVFKLVKCFAKPVILQKQLPPWQARHCVMVGLSLGDFTWQLVQATPRLAWRSASIALSAALATAVTSSRPVQRTERRECI